MFVRNIKIIGISLVALAMIGCAKEGDTLSKGSTPEKKIQIGLVFDIGGRGDKSFNDSAFNGLEMAAQEFGLEIGKDIEYIEPFDPADRESALRQLASKGKDIIIGVGFIFSEDINRVALDFPAVKFACVDYVPPEKATDIPPNVVGLKFKEEEGSFLVGAIAGLVTKTNIIGFVGGMQSPLIKKFEAGYKAGAKYVNPRIQVIANYAGVTPEAFKNPTKGKELGLSMYSKGADIIYHASGSTGLGVFEAARDKKKLAIGVDADQYSEAPGFILTSMIKRVDISVFEEIKAVRENRFQNGVRIFDLSSNGIDYVYDENNKNLITEDIRTKIEEIRKKIVDKEIQVPNVPE